MRKKISLKSILCIFAVLCISITLSSFSGTGNHTTTTPQGTQALWFDLQGNIGPYKIYMHINFLSNIGDKCGYYYYTSRPNTKYSLVMKHNSSAMAGSHMTLYEYTSRGYNSGIFKGYFSTRGTSYTGTFTNTTNGKKFKFELYEY